jgi:rubredoxin-NAD+ reductase
LSGTVVIVGTGLGGYTAARELRKYDKERPLVILTEDGGEFYSKPMLSNGFAAKKTADQLAARSVEQMRTELKAEIRTRTRVAAIDTARRLVRTATGEEIGYGQLVLALGADPLELPFPGDGAADLVRVNDLDDYRAFRSAIEGKERIAIIGAGLIGCEFANDLSGGGYRVALVDIAALPLGRCAPPEAGAAVRDALAALGVEIHLGATVDGIDRSGKGYRLRLGDGGAVEADIVVSAVGLRPRVALAEAAGIIVGRGIVVDRHLETSAPGVFAIGDCAEIGGMVLPFVQPIMNAARALGATLAGKSTPVRYPAMPIVVKTPCCPVVVTANRPDEGYSWRVEGSGSDITGRYVDAAGEVAGFVLTGKAVTQRNELLKNLPDLL